MRTAIGIVLGLLAGLLIGGLGLRADLRQARAELAQLRSERPRRTATSAVTGVAAMLRIPEERAVRDRPAAPAGDEPLTESLSPPATNAAPEPAAPAEPAAGGDDATSLDQRIRTATELWNLRVDLARESFLANVAASEEQAAQFDAVVNAMNDRLAADVRAWVDYLKEQPQVTAEAGVRIMQTLSGDVVAAYDELDGALPRGWRDQAGQEFQLFDFVDPAVAMPLTEVDEQMRQQVRPRPRHRRGAPDPAAGAPEAP